MNDDLALDATAAITKDATRTGVAAASAAAASRIGPEVRGRLLFGVRAATHAAGQDATAEAVEDAVAALRPREDSP